MNSNRDLFTASLYAVAGCASMMLAVAEGGWLIPAALTVPIAIAAYGTVEKRGRGISTFAANSLGFLAVVVALIELAVRDIEGRILFGAHLLVYLSWILLWQSKGPQQRWGLIALAVLQVAVGGVLTTAGGYGVAMAGFLVLMVWTLVLLQLAEAEGRLSLAAVPVATEQAGAAVLLAAGSVTPVGQAAIGRWPIRQIVSAVAVTVAGAAAVGAAFFLFIPRFEVSRTAFDETDTPLARQRVTGFTETVRLGAFGEILESTQTVFEVRLYDGSTDKPIDIETYALKLGYDEPLFRGLMLRDYENGEWVTADERRGDDLPFRPYSDHVRQEYRLQPSSSEVLFAIAPVYAGRISGTTAPIVRHHESRTLILPSRFRRRGEVSYEVYSPPDESFGSRRRRSESIDESEIRERFRLYLAVPNDLDRLRGIAAAAARPDGEPATPKERADRLLSYLRDSGEFRYTLTGELIDPSLDPVVDFLVNRKAGHCEYFASALALMLRAEGVPSRVVNGFKGGEKNRFSDAFEVQQRHAHAWVEAYVEGRWETFDPSPASGRNQTVAANAPRVPLWSEVRSLASNFWYEYVVQMNLSRQQRTFTPLREAAVAAATSFQDDWWPALRRQVHALATDPSRWFSWQGGVATFLGLFLIVGLWRVGRRLALRFARLRSLRAAEIRRGRRVEFYERFRRACERHGWSPTPGQTPREFAAGVASALATRPVPPRLAGLPGELTEDFYRVRFGDLDMPEPRLKDLEARLTDWETALANGSDGDRGGTP